MCRPDLKYKRLVLVTRVSSLPPILSFLLEPISIDGDSMVTNYNCTRCQLLPLTLSDNRVVLETGRHLIANFEFGTNSIHCDSWRIVPRLFLIVHLYSSESRRRHGWKQSKDGKVRTANFLLLRISSPKWIQAIVSRLHWVVYQRLRFTLTPFQRYVATPALSPNQI